ncbi:hypothetical protein AVO42_06090 [Thiomicrospira sp. XS5]|nr:hypothetical protein AVO42_06090 [Thiomicrospira sp. XS5]
MHSVMDKCACFVPACICRVLCYKVRHPLKWQPPLSEFYLPRMAWEIKSLRAGWFGFQIDLFFVT